MLSKLRKFAYPASGTNGLRADLNNVLYALARGSAARKFAMDQHDQNCIGLLFNAYKVRSLATCVVIENNVEIFKMLGGMRLD